MPRIYAPRFAPRRALHTAPSLRTATVEIADGSLPIRARPALGAPIVGSAADGEQLATLGNRKEWYLVQYGGTQGYVRSEYITLHY